MTIPPSLQDSTLAETPEDQAMAWILRLASGRATRTDADSLNRWREASEVNRKAFAEANLLWDKLGPAARVVADLQKQDRPLSRINRPVSRRAALAGFGAAAAAAGYLMVRPPFHLWPLSGEWMADFRTAVGEQRKITLFDTVSVTLNTETSLSRETPQDDSERVRLISGEAAFNVPPTTRRLIVEAAGGIIAANGADFQVRNIEPSVCVTCLSGQLRIRYTQQLIALERGQQVTYGDRKIQPVKSTDIVSTTAWQRGMLIFDSAPLAEVVDEINRYRPGRIVLLNQELARHPVVATFRIDQLNLAIGHLEKVFSLKAKTLPGGITVLT